MAPIHTKANDSPIVGLGEQSFLFSKKGDCNRDVRSNESRQELERKLKDARSEA